jgi:hypothetical protein
VLHLPFTGILTPAQPIAVTLQVPNGIGYVPLTFTVPDMTIGGAVPTLLVDLPRSIATALSPQ